MVATGCHHHSPVEVHVVCKCSSVVLPLEDTRDRVVGEVDGVDPVLGSPCRPGRGRAGYSDAEYEATGLKPSVLSKRGPLSVGLAPLGAAIDRSWISERQPLHLRAETSTSRRTTVLIRIDGARRVGHVEELPGAHGAPHCRA